MAKIVADALGGELDVVLVRKLRAPYRAELAVGSIDETGWTYITDYAEAVGADEEYLQNEKRFQQATMRRRRAQYTPVRESIDPAGRIVIIIDDGLATGSTMISALHSVRAKNPAKLICAIPVAPADTLKKVEPMADQVVCLETPEFFQAVGQFYDDFPQVDDEEVIALLKNR
jgi:predicted phosphoribosyltransferase